MVGTSGARQKLTKNRPATTSMPTAWSTSPLVGRVATGSPRSRCWVIQPPIRRPRMPIVEMAEASVRTGRSPSRPSSGTSTMPMAAHQHRDQVPDDERDQHPAELPDPVERHASSGAPDAGDQRRMRHTTRAAAPRQHRQRRAAGPAVGQQDDHERGEAERGRGRSARAGGLRGQPDQGDARGRPDDVAGAVDDDDATEEEARRSHQPVPTVRITGRPTGCVPGPHSSPYRLPRADGGAIDSWRGWRHEPTAVLPTRCH